MIITTHEILAMRDWTSTQINTAISILAATAADTYVNKNDDIPATHISGALADIVNDIPDLPEDASIGEITATLAQFLTKIKGA